MPVSLAEAANSAGAAPSDSRRMRIELTALLAVSALLLTVWAFVVPIFEGPDEPDHWTYARYIHDFHRLPLYGPGHLGECGQPPLYYALIAPLARKTELPSATTWRYAGGLLRRGPPPESLEGL